MNCSEFSEELQHLVESRSDSPSTAATTHINECSTCRQQWHDHLLLAAALRAWIPIANPPSLVDGVLNQLQSTTPGISVSARADSRRWTAVAMVAACLIALIAVGIIHQSTPDDHNVAQNDRRKQNQREPEPADSGSDRTIAVASSVVAVLEDLRTEYQEIAEETRASARDFAVAIPSTPVTPWTELLLPDVASADPPPVQSPASAPSQGAVSVISRSIGSQIGEAMDFLWVAVPDGVPKG